MNILESKEIDDSLSFDYFDVQNLLIDHSFSNEEIDNYKDLIFSPNSLRQIYFKGSCDLKTIELIKDLYKAQRKNKRTISGERNLPCFIDHG